MSIRPARLRLRLALQPGEAGVVAGLRAVRAGDAEALSSLMYEAYLGTVDYHGESEAEARDEVRRTLAGAYGEFRASSSRVLEREGVLVSGALVTRWEGRPMLAFLMTRPEWKRHGFARACVEGVRAQLLAEGERELWLAVTATNLPALELYRGLGFVEA